MTAVEEKKDGSSNGQVVDINTQENVSTRNGQPSARQSGKSQIRHRASVACASCRDRRIRCVVPQGQAECNQCRRAGTECVIKNDDERRRPISKAYMSSLSDRISMLEGMLMENGVMPPPTSHPPKTKHEGQSEQQKSATAIDLSKHQPQVTSNTSPVCDVPSPPDSRNDDFMIPDSEHGDVLMMGSQMFQAPIKEESPFRMLDPKHEDIVHRLLSTKGNLSFDQLSGRLRFFGPTANSHVYAETSNQFDSREPSEQVRRAERIIRSLTPSTYDYLMSSFWKYYNSVIQVIDRAAFEADRESQTPKFYSSFLHIAILAMGFRHSSKDREDIKKISLGSLESTLHRDAKHMLDVELERPGGIPSVQALLLLGDLECAAGRDNLGWIYSGIANRLAFDIGLHLDCRTNGMPEQEARIRRMVMKACVIYDKYWALFLGRPTSIKSQDLGMDLLSAKFSLLTSEVPAPPERDTTSEIYDQLIELMELAGRIVESRDNHALNDPDTIFGSGEAEDNAYLHVINLDRQLQNWYRRLPDHLAWKPSNIKTAPYSFFLLHQQWHVSMILLHRPWAKYASITGDGASTGSHPSPDAGVTQEAATALHPGLDSLDGSLGLGDPMVLDNRASLSRSICTQQAIRVARIFWQHRQRFDGRKIFVTGIQHAGTAVLALIAALAYSHNDADRRTYMGYLEILSDAVGDMSQTYQPAGRMDDLLKAVLAQIRASLGEPQQAVGTTRSKGFMANSMNGSARSNMSIPLVPSRREASDFEPMQPYKRRRPENSRRASEFARPPPPFFSGFSQLTGPHAGQGQHSFGLDVHQRHSAHLDPMLFPLSNLETGEEINLEFLSGSAIEVDSGEDINLVTPSSETWGLGSMHSDNRGLQGPPNFDTPIQDIGTEPAGPSATSFLAHGATAPNKLMQNVTFGAAKAKNDHGDGTAAMTNQEMDEMSPASLSGIVQSVEKSARDSETDVEVGTSRNHELDFFSFS